MPEAARAAFAKCLEFGAHSESIACKEDLASKAAQKVDRLFQLYREASAELDAEYKKSFPGQPARPGESFVELATASQDAWKMGVEKQCNFEEYTSFGGSGGGDFGAECRLRLNSQRADELQLALELANRQLKP